MSGPQQVNPCTGDGPFERAAFARFRVSGGDVSRATLSRLHIRYSPSAITGDLMLYPTRQTENSQQRYIDYNSSLEQEFPICGQGYVENGGSCVDSSLDTSEAGDTAQASGTGGSPYHRGLALTFGVLFFGLFRRYRGER